MGLSEILKHCFSKLLRAWITRVPRTRRSTQRQLPNIAKHAKNGNLVGLTFT